MNDDTMHTLVASTNRGRYALDKPEGQDLTGGQSIAIWLGGQWILGHVEHGGKLYASAASGRAEPGYYFIAGTGGVCGLCAGMRIRIGWEEEAMPESHKMDVLATRRDLMTRKRALALLEPRTQLAWVPGGCGTSRPKNPRRSKQCHKGGPFAHVSRETSRGLVVEPGGTPYATPPLSH